MNVCERCGQELGIDALLVRAGRDAWKFCSRTCLAAWHRGRGGALRVTRLS